MSFEGTVQNGVVVLDQPGALSEGARVEVSLMESVNKKPTLRERLRRLAGTVDDLPADLAVNHDR